MLSMFYYINFARDANGSISKSINCVLIDVIYPGVGHNLDFINKFANQNKIISNYIYREEDLKYWNYANSGFYKFKTSFNRINMV